MYCTRCGVPMQDDAKFCQECGVPTGNYVPTLQVPSYPRLSRPVADKKIAGVCAGFARYFGVDVTIVRVIWLVLIFFPFPLGLLGYVIAWIVMPRDPVALPAQEPAALALR